MYLRANKKGGKPLVVVCLCREDYDFIIISYLLQMRDVVKNPMMKIVKGSPKCAKCSYCNAEGQTRFRIPPIRKKTSKQIEILRRTFVFLVVFTRSRVLLIDLITIFKFYYLLIFKFTCNQRLAINWQFAARLHKL